MFPSWSILVLLPGKSEFCIDYVAEGYCLIRCGNMVMGEMKLLQSFKKRKKRGLQGVRLQLLMKSSYLSEIGKWGGQG